MGFNTSKSFTEAGLNRVYQYFIVNILIILVGYFNLFLVIIPANSIPIDMVPILLATIYFLLCFFAIWLVFDGFIKISLLLVDLILFLIAYFFPVFILFNLLLLVLILLYLLIFGITYVFLGRNEFGKEHKLLVVAGFIISIVYFVLYIINMFISKALSSIAFSTYIYNISLAIDLIFFVMILDIVLKILWALAFTFFVFYISDKKVLVILAAIFAIIGPFIFGILHIISMILFFIIYRTITMQLESEYVKPELMVPCPFCNKEIPNDSKSCPFCKKEFKLDPKFRKLNDIY